MLIDLHYIYKTYNFQKIIDFFDFNNQNTYILGYFNKYKRTLLKSNKTILFVFDIFIVYNVNPRKLFLNSSKKIKYLN